MMIKEKKKKKKKKKRVYAHDERCTTRNFYTRVRSLKEGVFNEGKD